MIKKLAVLGIFGIFTTSITFADTPFDNNSITIKSTGVVKYESPNKVSAQTSTQQYTVVLGDCLSAIARKLLGNENRWPEIVELNKNQYPSLISNPHMIEVGWVLKIPGGSNSKTSVVSSNPSNTNSTTKTSTTSYPLGNTQASEFYALGDRAYNEWQEYTENSARGEWIKKVGNIVKKTNTYGIKKSLIIAQIINESGWMSSKGSSLSKYNNVLGINTDMGRVKPEMQTSVWSKKRTSGVNNVTQWSSDGSHIVGTRESMRHYDSIEECIEDYANVVSIYHPECVGSNNIEDYRSFLEGYTPNPNASTTDKYKKMIKKFNLEKYDE